MADVLKMDPARIERLRDPARLVEADPLRILDTIKPVGDGDIVDVGAGVGFVSLPFAARLPSSRIVACDLLEGMLQLLERDAGQKGLGNLHTALMPDPVTLPLGDASASLLVMLQVHHELDDARGLLGDCRRVLMSGAPLVIVDWRDEDLPGMPAGGRRVAQSAIVEDLEASGFNHVSVHDVFRLHAMVVGITP